MGIIQRDNRKPTIDLAGPEGNAYALLGMAISIGKQVGMSPEKVKEITEEMKSGNYDNLVEVFDKNFGDYVDLILPEGYELNPEKASPTTKKKSQP